MEIRLLWGLCLCFHTFENLISMSMMSQTALDNRPQHSKTVSSNHCNVPSTEEATPFVPFFFLVFAEHLLQARY